MTIKCEIVTQERMVFNEDVDAVNLPGSEGRLGILPNHTPLLTTLTFGEVVIRTGDREEFFAVGGGFVEVQPDKVIILADSAEHAAEIDLERAEAARRRAEQVMREGVPEDPERMAQVRASLIKAQVRLNVGQRRRRSTMATGGFPPQRRDDEDQN